MEEKKVNTMDLPSSSSITGDQTTLKISTSLMDSFRGCGISGINVEKEELRHSVIMPEYLCSQFAIAFDIRITMQDRATTLAVWRMTMKRMLLYLRHQWLFSLILIAVAALALSSRRGSSI
ncbi:hypothetical protein TanjilG_29898 [Lupinus angustifolius]|uniref:Uncharacterized protein n=1 Tax=Lupinus angustifolius TaxID=3871 RepID=A0A394DCU0_LUPAN|nr:hypothetical protein TanjilG_29898 [Lupinus angustifolius]